MGFRALPIIVPRTQEYRWSNMSDVKLAHTISMGYWRRRRQTQAPVLFFDHGREPKGFEDSGLYLGFVDFKDVQREQRADDVPLTTLYHALIYHFSRFDQNLRSVAYSLLYHNPNNRSSWNEQSYTYRFHILGNALLEYSLHDQEPDRKIDGVGVFGNRIIRAVLDVEDHEGNA